MQPPTKVGGSWRWAAICLLAGVMVAGAACEQAERMKIEGGKQKVKRTVTGPAADAVWFGKKPPRGSVWMETLDLDLMSQEWGSPRVARSVDNHPLTLSGAVYPHGIGTHANSEWIIDLRGAAQRFASVVGVDDESDERGSVVFVVWVDGKEVKRSKVMRGGDLPEVMSVDLEGAKELVLMVEDAGDGIDNDHADWAGAMLTLQPGRTEQPVAAKFKDEPAPEIAKGTPAEPAIHAPRITGATPGRPFLFRIPATGEGPLRFAAENLPQSLALDPETGIITGVLTSEKRTEVRLTVEGPKGRARSNLTIVGDQRALALTPPMGWNSWNVWGTAVDDAKVRAAADWMVNSGLAAHGYQYVNIDDAWEGTRDPGGGIQTNEKFPDMKALADYVHSKGLKLGIYSSPGPKTCAGYEGSYQHDRDDAAQWADWGIDLVKYDWCSYGDIAKDKSLDELQKPYKIMREALDACGRDIVFSLCQYGMGKVSEWGAEVGGNYWRTTGDITDSWISMAGIGFGQDGLEKYAGPARWNDPDMLVVGKVGWGPALHDTRLTPNEQITHITLWSLLASPLLIGCDLSQIDEFTLALLTNPEVLEVNQDILGKQAKRVAIDGWLEVWARPLADGSLAVGLFNRGREQAPVTATWKDLGLSGKQSVRNLWLRQDQGTFEEAFTATVPRHGAVMLKIIAAKGDELQPKPGQQATK
jgi:alpha-galactosidase